MSLPSDIVRQIYGIVHPYCSNALMLSCKQYYKIAVEYRYQLLQTWCVPELSVTTLPTKYPNISLKQIVEASLYYYPIVKSLRYYPNLELLYNA